MGAISMVDPERRLKRQRRRAVLASGAITTGDLVQLQFQRGLVTRAELEAELGIGGVFGVPPTADAIGHPDYFGYVQAGDEAAAGILPVEGAVGYDVYYGRRTGPAW